jgi:hypothetical protein
MAQSRRESKEAQKTVTAFIRIYPQFFANPHKQRLSPADKPYPQMAFAILEDSTRRFNDAESKQRKKTTI